MNFKNIKIKARINLKDKYFKYFLISLASFVMCIEIKPVILEYPNLINTFQVSYFMVLIGFFLKPYYVLGVKKVYLCGEFSEIKVCFKKESNYLKRIWQAFFERKIIVFLSTLFFILPGIYKALEYIFMPYILAENIDMEPDEALKKSSRMTKGKKLMLLKFVLSFSGWYLLGFLCFGIGILFVNPYFEMSLKELYIKVKEENSKLGIDKKFF